jgi:3-hydroxybutyryl-CoA dehydrogenase
MALDIKKIGIIGSGQMGKGIAHVCAVAGFEVHLMDIDLEALKQAMPSIKKSMSRLVEKKKCQRMKWNPLSAVFLLVTK